jgi:hypothetical protein
MVPVKSKITKIKEKLYYSNKIALYNKVFVDNLISHGCIENKSLQLKFPTHLHKDLLSHFIRGYFDGDGCISDPKNSIAISIVGTKDFLEVIHHILDIPKYKIKHRQPLHSIEVNISEFSGEDARRFCLFVYNNSTIHLERKHERFIKHLEKHEYRIKKSKTTRVGTKVD